MATYVIDWDGIDPAATPAGFADDININGVNTLSDGLGGTTNVTVTAQVGATGNYFYVANGYAVPALDGALTTANSTGPVETKVVFDTGMTNITFEIYDIDQSLTGVGAAGVPWDDQVEIYALDISGNPVLATIIVSNTVPGQHTVSSDGTTTTINSTGSTATGIDGSGAADTVTIQIVGPVYGVVINYLPGPTVAATGVIGIGPITFTDPGPGCFVRGTMIETDRGEVLIEDLEANDLVRTLDNGFQPIRWIGVSTTKAVGSHAPILFRKGAIGNTRDLMVSPAHRVMLQGWQSELLFGNSEHLVPAQSLLNDHSIIRQESETVDYFHILFDGHEIVFSNGAPSESFHPNETGMDAMSQETRAEIYQLFPELEQNEGSYGPSARATLRPHEVALLNL